MESFSARRTSYQAYNPVLMQQEEDVFASFPEPPPKSPKRNSNPAIFAAVQGSVSTSQDSIEYKGHSYTAQGSSEPPEPSASHLPKRVPPAQASLRHAARFLGLFFTVAGILLIPIASFRADWEIDVDLSNARQKRNLVFWLFVWLEASWVGFCLAHGIALMLPHVFRGTAIIINSAHRKYWRVFVPLRWPITALLGVLFTWLAFELLFFQNWHVAQSQIHWDAMDEKYGWEESAAMKNETPTSMTATATAFVNKASLTTGIVSASAASTTEVPSLSFLRSLRKRGVLSSASAGPTNPTLPADDYGEFLSLCSIVDNILLNFVFWALGYFFVKIIIIYMTVHYHYRTDKNRIDASKRMQKALCKLYEASVYLVPPYADPFINEDLMLQNPARNDCQQHRREAAKLFQKIGGAGKRMVSLFGDVVGSDKDSHFFKADSPYTVVEHALEDPRSSAALAKRIWISLAAEGKDALTMEDICEALGPECRDEAEQYFKTLDENCNGDIRLDEMVPTVVEAGKHRRNIYMNMAHINHAINTFEWILLIFLAFLILFFIAVVYIPQVKQIKDTVGLAALGLSFAIGRTVHEVLMGTIFIVFKHPFDIGDRVEMFNPNEKASVALYVKRISLLYVLFERVDNGTDVQYPNHRLDSRRVENVTRSGLNREKIPILVHFSTTFREIELLRNELVAFVSQRENQRDYKPEIGLKVKSIHELNKLELSCTLHHKSNWSNESLRGARSSRFKCAIIAAVRKIGILKPKGISQGDATKPTYQVMLSEEDAAKKKKAAEAKKAAAWSPQPVEGQPSLENNFAPKLPSVLSDEHDADALEQYNVAVEKAMKEAEDAKKQAETKQAEVDAMIKFSEMPSRFEELRERRLPGRSGAVGTSSLNRFTVLEGDQKGVRRPRGETANSWLQRPGGWVRQG